MSLRGTDESFAGKYYCYELIYYEEYKYILDAIAREKELKKWLREKKIELVKRTNPKMNRELFVIRVNHEFDV